MPNPIQDAISQTEKGLDIHECRAADAVHELLKSTEGEDVTRDGLRETPERFVRAWRHYTSGYGVDTDALLKSFEGDGYDQLVVVRDIPFYSLCEHHLAPFFGTVTIGYLPSGMGSEDPQEERGRVVGLSKLVRLVEVFARRLQVQERMTKQIAEALNSSPLCPDGVGVFAEARHMCMESRGVCKSGATTLTSEVLGCFRHNPEVRSEFLSLARVGSR